jgi:hypothetical protein
MITDIPFKNTTFIDPKDPLSEVNSWFYHAIDTACLSVYLTMVQTITHYSTLLQN